MNITKVNFTKNEDEENTPNNFLGTADVVFDYDFIVKDIKVMDGKKGRYLIFPTDKTGRFLAFPSTEEYRQYILDNIIKRMDDINE